jgi:hypothetical protein
MLDRILNETQEKRCNSDRPMLLAYRYANIQIRHFKYQSDRHRLFDVHERSMHYNQDFSRQYRFRLSRGNCPLCNERSPLAGQGDFTSCICSEHGKYQLGLDLDACAQGANVEDFFLLEREGEYEAGLVDFTQESHSASTPKITLDLSRSLTIRLTSTPSYSPNPFQDKLYEALHYPPANECEGCEWDKGGNCIADLRKVKCPEDERRARIASTMSWLQKNMHSTLPIEYIGADFTRSRSNTPLSMGCTVPQYLSDGGIPHGKSSDFTMEHHYCKAEFVKPDLATQAFYPNWAEMTAATVAALPSSRLIHLKECVTRDLEHQGWPARRIAAEGKSTDVFELLCLLRSTLTPLPTT